MIKIAPSVLSADFSKLKEQIKQIEKSKAEYIHIDVMDGHFVPNISFGFPIVKTIRGLTSLTIDVHLMIENPSKYVKEFIEAGADIVTVHYEADVHIDRTINLIRSLGAKSSIALNPGTPVNLIENLISEVDMVLIMTVNPGFGGQKFIPYCKNKIEELKKLAKKSNENLLIEVDGGIDINNIEEISKLGANVFAVGSSAFKDGDIENNVDKLIKKSIENV
ncbi:ribulose-phosphate 3-epimerase [Clostridium felsineum]|uniref:ribulose-phosphate 3-epimerase n=1 Tax=Clostridium felsineum TaxID=36839 RepID=UPI00214D61BE|nr:ribulose-phosphate 3-epimerase [Clostridium felsineum]MCR3759613.1 ribulose-phosphate 3-epimerase [Clostridium felsineum]